MVGAGRRRRARLLLAARSHQRRVLHDWRQSRGQRRRPVGAVLDDAGRQVLLGQVRAHTLVQRATLISPKEGLQQLAERLGADNGRIARIILLSTAASFLTFSALVAVLRA